ncbi:MAG: hypothetical protein AAGN46_11375, partial [Acidobacteriota bacterium]
MSWLRRRTRPGALPGGVVPGEHRSPGLALAWSETARRTDPAVIDLGPSSTESLATLSELGHPVVVQDLYDGVGDGTMIDGRRAFVDAATPELPQDDRFDLVLVWDLLHFFRASDREAFGRRL